MNNKFVCLLAAWASLMPLSALADLTLIGYTMAGAFGMPMSNQERIWVRDNQIRRDYVDRGRGYSQLFDLNKQQVMMIDHAMRRIEKHDLAAMQAKAEVSSPSKDLRLNMESNGQTRPLKHWTCEGHVVHASVPTRLGNEETVFHLKGQLWVASDTAEQAAVKKLIKLTQQNDFFVGIPSTVKVTPAQTQLINEIIRKLASKGLPCGGELEASYEGNGPMANLARRMPTRIGITFQDFSTEPIRPETFVVPAGYSVY